jgi:coenzyme F420-dependent glucose-6-phosphate dehydrogenase
MFELGYKLSSEEHGPNELVRNAKLAEAAGFGFALISDHYHPWIEHQGQSPFVWCVLGGVAQATERLRIGTGVTCPTVRIHPAIIAQAAATARCMLPGRFFLGLGSGERLNEHILGDHWPAAHIRQAMLEEAIDVLRLLWQGGMQNHDGEFYTVENAQVFTLPDRVPEIIIAASGTHAAELAGRRGDGLIATAPKRDLIEAFDAAGGQEKPRYAELTVCWAQDEAEARRTAHAWWPNAGLQGELSTELALPRHIEQATQTVSEDDIAQDIVCGPDPQRYLDAVQTYREAGYTHIALHQVGPDQEGFLRFGKRELLPRLAQA